MEIAKAPDQCGVAVYRTSTGVGIYTWRLDDDGYPLNWRDRIRLCWKVITEGIPWTGEMVELEDREALRLARDIENMARE